MAKNKLTKHDNSLAVDKTSILITPKKTKTQKLLFASKLKKIHKQYRRTLKRLAK